MERFIQRNNSVTLIEILTVLIIMGILMALFLPHFNTMRERALDKEVKANMKLIQAAEKIYRMETGHYFPVDINADTAGSPTTASLNANLRLYLPAGANANWKYAIPDTGNGEAFVLDGTRNITGNWARVVRIDNDDESACCVSGECPHDIEDCQ